MYPLAIVFVNGLPINYDNHSLRTSICFPTYLSSMHALSFDFITHYLFFSIVAGPTGSLFSVHKYLPGSHLFSASPCQHTTHPLSESRVLATKNHNLHRLLFTTYILFTHTRNRPVAEGPAGHRLVQTP